MSSSRRIERRTRRRADRLIRDGRAHEAIDLMAAAVAAGGADGLVHDLVRLRYEGYKASSAPTPEQQPPTPGPPPPDGFATEAIPEVDRSAFDAETLRSAIAHHGCLWVRGLFDDAECAALRAGIDRSFDALDAWNADRAGTDDQLWYHPFEPRPEDAIGAERKWGHDTHAIWGVDAPRALAQFLELVDAHGVRATVTDHLGARPALSVKKCSLRRVPPETRTGDWHQDGSFLGTGVRTVNMWLTLSDAGVDAPGLDVVPRRLDQLAPTGVGGAHFDWSVGPETVTEVAAGRAVLRPEFTAGDALFFDDLFLHRTATAPHMTDDRYCIETWFFAPTGFPTDQIPILL